jgi:hypothetical protein
MKYVHIMPSEAVHKLFESLNRYDKSLWLYKLSEKVTWQELQVFMNMIQDVLTPVCRYCPPLICVLLTPLICTARLSPVYCSPLACVHIRNTASHFKSGLGYSESAS